ncbi:MAG TPA: 2-hydroxyacyl-CoA dehydratase, partial [Candidatus Angelobacter sp.]
MDIERTFDKLNDLQQDLSFGSVREWKREHPAAKAVAFFPVYAPVEIIHAAGMLPVCLAGAGDRLDIQHADSRFGSFICSIVKTSLEMAMTGHLDPFDGFLFSSICDSARNLCFVLKRNFPQMYVDFIHLPHNSSSAATIDFLEAEYRRLIAELERLGGTQVTDAALQTSIDLYNRQRSLVGQLYDIRARSPHLLRAWESYLAVRAGNLIPVEQHIAILEDILHQVPRRPARQRDSIRVVVEGSFCEQPPLEVIRLLEAAGCDIVEDDFALAQRWFRDDVPNSENPVRTLAES